MKSGLRSLGLSAFCCVFLSGCAGSATRVSNFNMAPGRSIPAGAKVLVLTVPDGGDEKDGKGMGAAVGSAIRDELLKHGFSPRLSQATSIETGYVEARDAGYAYLLHAVITEFEDNATNWSHKPDRAGLSVEVFEVATKDLVGAGTHTCAGPTNDPSDRKPVRFIPELVDSSLGKLFGWPPTIVTEH